MPNSSLRFAIFGNVWQARKSQAIASVLAALRDIGADVMVEKDYYDFLLLNRLTDESRLRVFAADDFDADIVVSMGGDGTFLKAASLVGAKQIPIVGVNMGRLGFLADITPDNFAHCLEHIVLGKYSIEPRAVIRVQTDGQPLTGIPYALNDVAILKRDNASMISIHASVDGNYLTTYQADGLVVSTPTGSTAYSLSNGGPIIAPGTGVFSMTAVAPHSLSARPMVLSDASRIDLAVCSRSHNFLIAIDGRSEPCPDATRITLSRAPFVVNVLKRHDTLYFDTLREKMMWGADARG